MFLVVWIGIQQAAFLWVVESQISSAYFSYSANWESPGRWGLELRQKTRG